MANQNPNLWANPTNRPAKLWNLTWDQYLSLDGAVWKAILIALGSIFAMSLLNWFDIRGLNLPITIIGYLGIWWFGMRPTHMAYSAVGGGVLAALFDRDKSQGVGSGPYYLFKVVQKVSYTFLLIGFSLFTWDFSDSFGAFWVTLVGIIILTQTGDISGWRVRLIIGYVLICIIAVLWTTIGVYSGRAFDPATGHPLYMVDPTTGRIDAEGRTPKECKWKACFSTETGERLRPMTQEEALKRNPAGIGSSLIDTVDKEISSLGSSTTDATECPEEILSVVYGTRITVPVGCKVDIDATLVRNGNFEYEFADESLPIVNGKRLLNGKPIEAYLTHSFGYAGRDRYGMRFTTTSRKNFAAANTTEIEVIILEKGKTVASGITLTAE